MRILVDQDEVLAQFVNKVLKRWNANNGTNFVRNEINVWRMEDVLGKDKSGRNAEGLIDEWLAEPGFFEDLEPMPGAITGFELLRKNHDVLIVTSIPEVATHAYDGKRKWVRKHFPTFSMKNFIACSRKEAVDGDLLIDDGSHNINAWLDAGKNLPIVMDAPWNRDIKRAHFRVSGWGALQDLVTNLQRNLNR